MASKLLTLPDNSNELLYIDILVDGETEYSGYKRDYLARNLTTMEEELFVCNVCAGIMRQPSLYEGVITCLVCSHNVYRLNIVNMVQDSVMALEIKCPLLRDCEWNGKLSEAETHLKVCDNFLIKCAKCEQIFPRRKEDRHKSDVCQMREIRCKYGCGKSGYAKDLGKHEKCCIKIPILCQNGCGIKFPRECTSEHRSVCELEETTCPYAEYGCEAKPMLRRDLLAHKKENIVEHTDMSLNRIKQLENEKKNVEGTMRQLDRFEWEFRCEAFPHYEQIEGPTFYINNYKLRLYIMRKTPQSTLSLLLSPDLGMSFSIKRIEGEFDKQLGIAAFTHYRVIIVDEQNYSKSHFADGPMNYQLKLGENSKEFCNIDYYTCKRLLTADNCISVRFSFGVNTQPPLGEEPEENATMLTSSKTSDIDPFNRKYFQQWEQYYPQNIP